MESNAVILHKFWRPQPTLPRLGLQFFISKKTRTTVSVSSMQGVFAESSLRKQAWRNPKEGRVGCLHQNIFTRKVTDIAFTSDFCNNYSHPASPASLYLTSPRPRPTRPRVPYLMSSSPSSRVPKSPSPHTRVPMSPSHFYTQPFCLKEVLFIPRLSSYWKSQLPQRLMACIWALRRFLVSFVCFCYISHVVERKLRQGQQNAHSRWRFSFSSNCLMFENDALCSSKVMPTNTGK